MINTTAKGNRRQNACRKQLEEDGWLTYTARRGYKGQKIDIFGLFDIIAYKVYNWGEAEIKLIQVKSNVCPNEVRMSIRAFQAPLGVRKEIWVYEDYNRNGPRIERTN